MAKSLDGLIQHLLDRIALCGELGVSPSDYIAYVKIYYDLTEEAVVGFGDKVATSGKVPNIDRPFLQQVWKWLIGHPEITLGHRTDHKRLTLSDVEAHNAAIEQSQRSSELIPQLSHPGGIDVAFQGSTSVASIHHGLTSRHLEHFEVADTAARVETAFETAQDSITAPAESQSNQNSQKDAANARHTPSEEPTVAKDITTHDPRIRLYASENRMWQALTGHGPDLNKIRLLDFACLSLIGASGSKGIYQNDLVRKSGQDKRSLPTRTERLFEDGYIQKERVCVQLRNAKRLLHTSHLILKRFAKEITNQSVHQENFNTPGAFVEEETGESQDLDENPKVELSRQATLQRSGVSKFERPVPQWIPDTSLSNQIFYLVDQSGTQGMSMNDIRDNLFGEFVRRPAAEYVTRLTECWQMSQPLHLRHLSIIRDTILKGKGSIFNYYSYESFKKLVERGVGFWEAVVTVPDDQTTGRTFAASLDEVPELDDFGFPMIDPDLFLGPDNNANPEECASVLNADVFHIQSNSPVLQRHSDGTNGKQSVHPNAASRKPKVPALNRIFPVGKPQKSGLSQHLGVGVKRRGRPPKYPTADTSINVDKMDIHTIKKFNRSQELAEQYARKKIEKEITCRIAEGGNAVLVTNGVLEETEFYRKGVGQEPLSDYTTVMILHKFAGGPEPPPLKHKRSQHRRPREAPYRPSMAAHTIFVPDPGRILLPGSSDSRKLGRRVDSSLKEIQRPPTRLPEQEIEADTLPARKKSLHEAVIESTAVVTYRPSIAAHTGSHILLRSLSEGASHEIVKGKRGRPRKVMKPMGPRPKGNKSIDLHICYLPSMFAHSGSLLSAKSPPIAQSPKRSGLSKAHAHHVSPNMNPASPSYRTHTNYLPSMAIQSPSCLPTSVQPSIQATISKHAQREAPQHDELPATPASQTTATQAPLTSPVREVSQIPMGLHVGSNPEDSYPDWVKYMSRYYERDLEKLARQRDGIYLGKTTRRRKRKTEPVGFRPQFYKLMVFKSARLLGMAWFIENVDASPRASSGLTNGQGFIDPQKQPFLRPSSEQSDGPPAVIPSSQMLMSSPRILRDQSSLLPAYDASSHLWKTSPCWKSGNGSSASHTPYSRPSPVKQVDGQPPSVSSAPYNEQSGIKRKREESYQPHRDRPPSRRFSMKSYRDYGYPTHTTQLPENKATRVIQEDSPSPKNNPPNMENANASIADTSCLDTMNTSHEAENIPSGFERGYFPVEVASSPIAEDPIVQRASDHPNINTITSKRMEKEIVPLIKETDVLDRQTRPDAEEFFATIEETMLGAPSIIDGIEEPRTAWLDRTRIILGRSEATEPSVVRATTPPLLDKDEIVGKNMARSVQDPKTDDFNQHDDGPILAQAPRPINSAPISDTSTKIIEQNTGGGNSLNKSPGSHATTVTSIPPSVVETQHSGTGLNSLQNPVDRESPVTKPKPMTGRKFFGKMNRQGGSVAMLRKVVVMDIIDKCGGVYPGHKELIKAFVIEWEKRGLDGGTPEDKTMQTTVNALCNEGKLQQIKFCFKDQKGMKVTKDMLVYPSFDVMDPRVKDVQRRVIAHHPRYFWPSAVVPPDEYSAKTQRMMDGKGRVQDARYMALKAKEQLAELERRSRNGTIEESSTHTACVDSEQILEVPHISQISQSRAIRPDGLRLRGSGRARRVVRIAALRNSSTVGTSPLAALVQSPLPRPVSTSANIFNDLLWLPEQYAFSEFNYEEERPTVLEPTIRDYRHRRHTRYGMQLDPPKRIRRKALRISANNGSALSVASIEQDQAMANGKRPSLPYSDFRSGYPSSQLALTQSTSPLNALQSQSPYSRPAASQLGHSFYSSPYGSARYATPSSALQSQTPYVRPAASHLGYSSCNSPHTAGDSEQNLALSVAKIGNNQPASECGPVLPALDTSSAGNLGYAGKSQPSSRDPPAIRSVLTWLPVEQTHNFRPRPKELIVNFMDALHYFHQSSGTFSVGFLGFAAPRPISKDVGTCSKPYSYGSRTIHRNFPPHRGPRSFLPKRSLEAEDTEFEKEVDSQLRWELETKGLEHARFGQPTFINHVFSHVHITVEAVDANMDQLKGFILSSDGKRVISRRLANVNTIRPRPGDSVPKCVTSDTSTTAPEARKGTESRAILKRRRLTTLVEGMPQGESSTIAELDGHSRRSKLRRIRGPREIRLLHGDDERPLLIAVMIVRTLAGGLDQLIDWALIARVFDNTYEQKFVVARWPYIRNKFKLVLPQMEVDFQEMFAKAYEEGSIPALDFDNLEDYDWKWLAEWTLEHLGTWGHLQPDLPAERAEFNDLYTLKDTSEIDINDYYEINGAAKHTAAKRESVITSSSYVYPMETEGAEKVSQDKHQLAIAISWVRANFVTPASLYKPDDARVKLGTFPEEIIDNALRQLLSDRVLSQENKGRLIPGRNYHISDHFISRLSRNLLPAHFHRAVEFKHSVDEGFAAKGSVLFPYTADDGDVLAVTNLLAHKCIKLVPRNLPLNKWGQVDGGYETRLMDKNRLNFQIDMHPLPSYVGGNPLEPIPPPPSQHLQDPMAKIPLWYGINGELALRMWAMALAAVMTVLAMRPGVDAEEIEKVTKPAMDAWEIDIVLGWLVEAKAGTRVGSGYVLDQWWWLALPTGDEAGIDPLTAHRQSAEVDAPSNGQTLDE